MFLFCVYPLYKFRILDFHFRFLCFILTFFLRVIVQVKVDDFLLSAAVHSSALKRNLEKTGYVKKKRKEKREKRKKKEKRNKEKTRKKACFQQARRNTSAVSGFLPLSLLSVSSSLRARRVDKEDPPASH